MASVISGSQVKLNSGQTIQAANGGWYDGQQFWNGSLGAPGIGNNPNQADIYQKQAPTFNAADAAYIAQRQAETGTPSGGGGGTPGGGGGSAGGGAGIDYTAPASINLPQLYEQLYASSGIRNTEADLNAKTEAYNAQVAKIKDNPYLSEATMTGRIAKLDSKFTADKNAINGQIATKKADIETQLDLQTKQFDINSQQAKDSLDRFNTLLSSGALDSASGDDIANLTRATGLSSSAIYSAINANKAKNITTSVINYDDGTNQGFAVVNTKTGEIISTQKIAGSKPTKTSGSGTGSTDNKSYTSKALTAIQAVDTNKDKRLSVAEYTAAVQKIMTSAGIDFATADDYAEKAFSTLGYVKWGKGW